MSIGGQEIDIDKLSKYLDSENNGNDQLFGEDGWGSNKNGDLTFDDILSSPDYDLPSDDGGTSWEPDKDYKDNILIKQIEAEMSGKRKIRTFPAKPGNPNFGDVYKDTNSGLLNIYDGKKWIEFEPSDIDNKTFDNTINDDGTIPGIPTVILDGTGRSGVKPSLNRSGIKLTPEQLVNTTDETALKYVYCPRNYDMTVMDVLNNRINYLCGPLTREKYEEIISRCTPDTEFDGIKNLKCKVCEFGAVLDKLEALTGIV